MNTVEVTFEARIVVVVDDPQAVDLFHEDRSEFDERVELMADRLERELPDGGRIRSWDAQPLYGRTAA